MDISEDVYKHIKHKKLESMKAVEAVFVFLGCSDPIILRKSIADRQNIV